MTGIINLYDQRDGQSGKRLAHHLNWTSVIQQGGTVLAGDFNAHSRQWDPRCQWPQNASCWEEVIDENELEIGNEGRSTHHWMTEGH